MVTKLFSSHNSIEDYDTNNLYVVSKADADLIVQKALEINPKLFEQGYEVGVSPQNNTVYFYKHAPKPVNAFEAQDMIFATCVTVCATDKQVCRVCSIYCTPEEFEKKKLPTAIDGYEVSEIFAKADEKETNLENYVSKSKMEKLKGIEKQDLSLLVGLENAYKCVERDGFVNDRNDLVMNIYNTGAVQVVEGNGNMPKLNITTQPQYVYRAYQFIKDAVGNDPNVSNIRYDVPKGVITLDKFFRNDFYPNGKTKTVEFKVFNDYIFKDNAMLDTRSSTDKELLKSKVNCLEAIHGDSCGNGNYDFAKSLYLHNFFNSRLYAYIDEKEHKAGRWIANNWVDENGKQHYGERRLTDAEWAEKQAQMKVEQSSPEPEQKKKTGFFGKRD